MGGKQFELDYNLKSSFWLSCRTVAFFVTAAIKGQAVTVLKVQGSSAGGKFGDKMRQGNKLMWLRKTFL